MAVMDVTRVDSADSGAVRACYEVALAAWRADDPDGPPAMPLRGFTALLDSGWIGDPRQAWMAADGSGYYQLELPERDNRHMARLELVVHPGMRRQGRGTALLEDAMTRTRQAGRTLITTDAWVGSAGESFARDAGFKAGLIDIRRVLRVGAAPAPVPTAGYTLVEWGGQTPPELAGQVAAVIAMIADAPSDPSWEPEQWDADRVRITEERIARQGLRQHTVAARHDATGELAAITNLALYPEIPDWGFQELTAVTRAHRGHRLGLAVKSAMLRRLAAREPRLERIVTWNAEDNKHMIAINEELGFVPLGRPGRWLESVVEA
jgi:GNAT superfamily N-acetyltransferase